MDKYFKSFFGVFEMHKTKKHKMTIPFDLDNVKELEVLGNRHIEKQIVHQMQQEVQAEMDRELLLKIKNSFNGSELSDLVKEYYGEQES